MDDNGDYDVKIINNNIIVYIYKQFRRSVQV